MIENSTAGLVMLPAAVSVTVTSAAHHRRALSRYPITSSAPRRVAVELRWCTIASGSHRGYRAVAVHLDGHRVGELTRAMSEVYAPTLNAIIARGARPGCEAEVSRGAVGIELAVRLPRQNDLAPTHQ